MTDNAGEVRVEVSRDRHGTYSAMIVAKRSGGCPTWKGGPVAAREWAHDRDIAAHFAEVYGASVSKYTVCPVLELPARGAGSQPAFPVRAFSHRNA
jgi:putative transposase